MPLSNEIGDKPRDFIITRQEGPLTVVEPWYQIKAEVLKRGHEFYE